MANYPTLSRNPVFPMNESREDSTIRSDMDGGYELTRPRFTRVRRTWELSYLAVLTTDKNTLMTFYDTTVSGGADAFNWTNPQDSQTYSVRFTEPPKTIYIAPGIWNINVSLREV